MQQWVWQDINWPNFRYLDGVIAAQEKQYLQNAGYLLGAYNHISASDQEQLKIDLVSDEAVESSAIEGEFLDRSSVQASLRRNFGLAADAKRIPPMELGIALMMADLYKNYAQPLTHEILCNWHLQLMGARGDLNFVGAYRQHNETMQIVSGNGNKLRVHYEAPPSSVIQSAMQAYIKWFNNSAHLPVLTRAGIAHLYFELIHPFEDGNGRIGRAVAEKAVSQSLQQPLLSAMSRTIQKRKKEYYAALGQCNSNLDITVWLEYFAAIMLDAQKFTREYLEFLSARSKLFDRVKDQLNERQTKVVSRIFKEGLDGFKGGLSAENYIAITQTSRATATRDLQDLVLKQVLYSTGERKSTRYFLNL